MIVAFLDLLGFSALLQTDTEVALDNMNSFNNVTKTRFIDNKRHPLSEYEERYPYDTNFHNFVEKSSVTAFEQMISFSDSLVLGGTDCDLFIIVAVIDTSFTFKCKTGIIYTLTGIYK